MLGYLFRNPFVNWQDVTNLSAYHLSSFEKIYFAYFIMFAHL